MLSQQNIESELSYAYLHAIACNAGFSCEIASRHLDNAAVDAVVREDGRKLADNSVLSSFDLHVQLKATFQQPVEKDGKYSYSLELGQYDKLRRPNVLSQKILAVLYLPNDIRDWVKHSEDGLLAKRCMYWVSLRDAIESNNKTHQTVYIPRSQILSSESLTEIMKRISRDEKVNYGD